MISILPFLLEHRLSLNSHLAQNVSLMLIAQSALVSLMIGPVLAHIECGSNAKRWLLFGLVAELLGSMVIASARSRMYIYLD